MIIRKANLEEASVVIDLYRGYNRTPAQAMDATEIATHFSDINRNGFVAVALLDDVIVGTYSLHFCATLAHAGRPFAIIENVIVAVHARRKGIGRALTLHAQKAARDRGCYKVMLATGSKRITNLQFYEACGFIGDKIGFQMRFQ